MGTQKRKDDGVDRTRGQQVFSVLTSALHALSGWTVVARYPSNSSSSKHTVESDGTGTHPSGYRCTCMGYKIVSKRKVERGELSHQQCTHTQQAHREGLK